MDAGSNERLEIVLGVNPGTVDGAVVSKSGDVVGNAAVILVPNENLGKPVKISERGRESVDVTAGPPSF